jgi:pimeloyl-ACP methyl ester carboxylesterase
MPTLHTDDGVRLYYEEAGTGTPLVFVHEFAGDLRSYEAQMRHFSRAYRCIAYNARGYAPSEIPEDWEAYSQQRATDDIRAVLDALRIERAHVVGISMGGFATVHFALRHADRALSLTAGGVGYGSPPEVHERFAEEASAMAERIAREGMAAVAGDYALASARVQFQNKDPRGWAEFRRHLAEHDTVGSANTMRGYQARRPSLYDFDADLAKVEVPMLILAGDEDDPALDASLWLKRTIPSATLGVFPGTGHALNQEEPALFNQLLQDFLHRVDVGAWTPRDPRSDPHALLDRR